MSIERFYTTGKALFWVFPVIFILSSSCSTFDPKVTRAIARRAIQAAADAGAQTSKCASRDYYEAERNLNMGEKWMMDKGISDYSDEYFTKAISYGEKAEEGAIFCGK
jgi:hypothetical protein